MNERNKLILMAFQSMITEVTVGALNMNQPRQRRSSRAREHLMKPDKYEHGERLCKELLTDTETFFNFTQMSVQQFDDLLGIVEQDLSKLSIRKPISPRVRLFITLRFLTTGSNYSSLGNSFRIGKSTVYTIVQETMEKIWIRLNEKYIPKPSLEDLKKIADSFYESTGMPNCIGAIDCKHCVIQAPNKKIFSIVLLAVCDSNYNFTYFNVGANDSESDGDIVSRSDWGKKLLNNELHLPENRALPNTNIFLSNFFVGNEAFPLKTHLMRPYSEPELTNEKQNFNKNLSKARHYIENTFGILAAKFHIYHTKISAKPELAEAIVKCTIVLHNYIRKTTPSTNLNRLTTDYADTKSSWRDSVSCGFISPTPDAQHIRETLAEYLLNSENTNE